MSACTCSPRDLLNKGCCCGFLSKKKLQKQETHRIKRKGLSVNIFARQFIVGGIRIGFKVYGSNEKVRVEFQWEKQKMNGSKAWRPVDLESPSHGVAVLSTPNCIPGIENIRADSRTEYWVIWDTSKDAGIKAYGIKGPPLKAIVTKA